MGRGLEIVNGEAERRMRNAKDLTLNYGYLICRWFINWREKGADFGTITTFDILLLLAKMLWFRWSKVKIEVKMEGCQAIDPLYQPPLPP